MMTAPAGLLRYLQYDTIPIHQNFLLFYYVNLSTHTPLLPSTAKLWPHWPASIDIPLIQRLLPRLMESRTSIQPSAGCSSGRRLVLLACIPTYWARLCFSAAALPQSLSSQLFCSAIPCVIFTPKHKMNITRPPKNHANPLT